MALEARQKPTFEESERRRIYEFVERNGRVSPAEVADAVGMEPESFNHELSMLKRDDIVEERAGDLCVVLESGTAEEFHSGGVTYEIRPARQDDLTGIVGAIKRIAEEKTDIVAESVAEQVDYEGVLIRHNDVETRMFFVASVNDDVVGWTHLQAPELEKLRHAARITVGVLDEYRRHGIGGHLLHRGLEWAASQGYRKVYNSVPATNDTAAEFLADHGFETEAIRRDHYNIGDEFVSEVMMAKQL